MSRAGKDRTLTMTINLATSFTVPLPVEESWTLLQDMDRVARWFPGAKLEGVEGEKFTGTVRVKLGPMVVDYRGIAHFVEQDEQAHRVILEASGREQRGTGTAKAVAVTQLQPDGRGTTVSVSVELDISGRPAQLGQGLMQEVAQRLVATFSEHMRADLQDAESTREPSNAGTESNGPAPSRSGRNDTDVLNLGPVLGPAMLRRVAPIGIALVVVLICWSRSRARDKERVW